MILKNIFFTVLAAFILISAINTVYAGKYTAKDIERLKAFADIGDPDAMNELGVIYFKGLGNIDKDFKLAEKYYTRAVQLGDNAAKSNLGYLLHGKFEKYGIKPDYKKSLVLLKTAAANGYLQAYVSLGIAYDDGLGVPKNPALAEKYYKITAEAGVVEGQFDLAYFYMHQKNKKSYYWFKKAAENKYANAYTYLAIYYISATVVKKDLAKAYMYAKYGKILGAQGADNVLNKAILPEINPAEKAEGEKLLKEYIAKHPINND